MMHKFCVRPPPQNSTPYFRASAPPRLTLAHPALALPPPHPLLRDGAAKTLVPLSTCRALRHAMLLPTGQRQQQPRPHRLAALPWLLSKAPAASSSQRSSATRPLLLLPILSSGQAAARLSERLHPPGSLLCLLRRCPPGPGDEPQTPASEASERAAAAGSRLFAPGWPMEERRRRRDAARPGHQGALRGGFVNRCGGAARLRFISQMLPPIPSGCCPLAVRLYCSPPPLQLHKPPGFCKCRSSFSGFSKPPGPDPEPKLRIRQSTTLAMPSFATCGRLGGERE